ncbi:hypothetical protein GX586_13255, partial [bacterium]|nr:hypothetical protein [bacterium]
MKRTARISITAIVLLSLLASAARVGAADLFWGGGDADIANGTPLPSTTNAFAGEWNASTKNWCTTSDGSTYAAWADGDVAQWGASLQPGEVWVTNNVDTSFAGMFCSLTPTLTRYFNITATSARTLTVTGDNAMVMVLADGNSVNGLRFRGNVTLGGTVGVLKTGCTGWHLDGNNSYSGPVTVNQGAVVVTSASGAALNNVNTFNCVLKITNVDGSLAAGELRIGASSGANNKLSDDAVVTLRRGVFYYAPVATSTETLKQIIAEPWGVINLANGAAGGIVTLNDGTAGISRGTTGRGTLCVTVPGTGQPLANIRVQNGVATDVLLPWMHTDRSEFMQVVSANNNALTQILSTAAATDLSSWDTTYDNTSVLRIGNSSAVALTGVIDANTTVKALGIYNSTASTITNAPGVTLTIASGGIAFAPAGGQQFIAGGALASGTNQLYLNANNSGMNNQLLIHSAIAGTFDVIKSGVPTIRLGGGAANTYNGTTYVNSGTLQTEKPSGVVAVPGAVVIEHGGRLNISGQNNVAAAAEVTINDGGYINLGANQTHTATVTINGGTYFFQNMVLTLNASGTGLVFNGGRVAQSSTATGTLNLNTDVSYASSATQQAVFEKYSTGAYNIEL